MFCIGVGIVILLASALMPIKLTYDVSALLIVSGLLLLCGNLLRLRQDKYSLAALREIDEREKLKSILEEVPAIKDSDANWVCPRCGAEHPSYIQTCTNCK
jgi:hypothetical protein